MVVMNKLELSLDQEADASGRRGAVRKGKAGPFIVRKFVCRGGISQKIPRRGRESLSQDVGEGSFGR
jgi:hypothetical protein